MVSNNEQRKAWTANALVLDDLLVETVLFQFLCLRRSLREIHMRTQINPYLSQEALRRALLKSRNDSPDPPRKVVPFPQRSGMRRAA